MNNDDLISRQAAIDALESIGSLDTNAEQLYLSGDLDLIEKLKGEAE